MEINQQSKTTSIKIDEHPTKNTKKNALGMPRIIFLDSGVPKKLLASYWARYGTDLDAHMLIHFI